MDIGKFIDEYVVTKDPGAKERLAKKHVKTTYVSYAKKIDDAKRIVKHSCYDADERFTVNSPMRYMLFIICVVTNYTDLEFSKENTLEQFDLLLKHGILRSFLPMINDDYENFKTILNMVYDDEYENNRTPVSFAQQKLDVLLSALDAMAETEVDDGGRSS